MLLTISYLGKKDDDSKTVSSRSSQDSSKISKYQPPFFTAYSCS